MIDQILVGRVRAEGGRESIGRGLHDALGGPNLLWECFERSVEEPLRNLILIVRVTAVVSHEVENQSVRVLPKVLNLLIQLLNRGSGIHNLKSPDPQKADPISVSLINSGEEGVRRRCPEMLLKIVWQLKDRLQGAHPERRQRARRHMAVGQNVGQW